MVEALVRLGADVHMQNRLGRTALDWATDSACGGGGGGGGGQHRHAVHLSDRQTDMQRGTEK